MSHIVNCVKLGYKAEGLEFPPIPGSLGKLIYQNVSKAAWQLWLKQQTILINENRLNMSDIKARQYLFKEIEQHFFGSSIN